MPARGSNKQIRKLLAHFGEKEQLINGFMKAVVGFINESKTLQPLVHSIKFRLKSLDRIEDKLQRKLANAQAEGREFDITPENLLAKVTDLAGIRILHLHTSQFAEIDRELRNIIREQKFTLAEGPFARTWDDEYRDYFRGLNVEPQPSPNMYTSVHYVIASGSETTINCEIQVRTLMEEVWGEVDHLLNYPHKADSVACREQIKALARVTSSATRLVDSIFATAADIDKSKKPGRSKPRRNTTRVPRDSSSKKAADSAMHRTSRAKAKRRH